jgi:oligopeptide transport system ATP-binding protein
MTAGDALLEVRGLVKEFPLHQGLWQRQSGVVRALRGVDLDVPAGRSVALVGESGSGKSTLARCVMRLERPTAGSIRLGDVDLLALRGRALRARRRAFQMVFQDPYGSLDPRMRVGDTLAEPLELHGLTRGAATRERVAELLGLVGLPAALAARFPHELSGGQRQRVGIARALAPGPELLVADEPVSALDVSVRAQILNLLLDLQERLDLAMLFISHDLAVVERVATTTYVLYLGQVVERGPTAAVIGAAAHPYTVSLLAAVPRLETVGAGAPAPRLRRLGEPASPSTLPSGCPFHPRCAIARPRCAVEAPSLGPAGAADAASAAPAPASDHLVACHYPGEARLAEVLPVPGL